MAIFNVTYSNGKKRTENQADCHTVAQFMSCRFGSCDTSKVKVTMAGEEASVPKKAKK